MFLISLVLALKLVNAVDIGWTSMNVVPSAYFRKSTQNALRCGNLCERQGRCVAATFDYRERMCHLHNTDPYVVETITVNGQYLFKRFLDNPKNHELKSTCDRDTQIILPTGSKQEFCHDIRPPYNPIYLGCYKDEPARDLDSYLERYRQTNTKALCIYFCYQSGYKFGGLQAGYACLCGNSYGKYGQLNETKCGTPCAGNISEICGGPFVNSVYSTGL